MSTANKWFRAGCVALAVLLCVAFGVALAETGRGDLDERFSDVPRIEYNGETFFLRDRLTVLLVTGVMPDEQGVPHTDFAAVFAIDDNEKRITPIYIDGTTLIKYEGEPMQLRDVFALGEDPEENMLRMAAAVNSLLGSKLIEDYMGVDLDGISAVTELGKIEGDTRQRLHLLRLALERIPSKELNELYGRLSAYLITNMKSGAVMRALDKSDRYEVVETVDLPVLPEQEGQLGLQPDTGAIAALAASVFYEKDIF